MKRQQLVSSFFLASATAVLVNQVAWADNVQVKAVRLVPTVKGLEVTLETPSKEISPPVFTASSSQTLVADIINTQLRLPKGDFRAVNPTDSISDVTVVALNANTVRISVTGKDSLPQVQVSSNTQGIVLKIAATNNAVPNPIQSRIASNTSKPVRAEDSIDKSNLASNKKKTQATPSVTPSSTSPVSPIPTQATVYPRYLNPNSNPLQFPTSSNEVRIQGTQPITLEQAYAIAERNNRDLQVAELTLERSRAALRQAQAALYPTVNLSAEISNSGNGFINNNTGSSVGSLGGVTTGTTGTGTTIGTTGIGTTGTTTGTGTTTSTTGTTTGATGNTVSGTPGTGTTSGTTTNTGTTTGTGTTGNTVSGTPGTGTTTGTTGTTGTGTTGTAGTTGTTGTTGTGTTGTTGTGTTGTRTTGTRTTGTGTTTPLRTSVTSLTGTVAVSYNVYTSGGRSASIRAAQEQVHFEQLGVEAQAETIRLTVATDYYNLQNADQQVLIQQAAVTNALASLRDAQALEQAGVGTRFDTLRAQVQVANSTQSLTNAQAQQQIARRQLAQLLSISQSVDLSAADPVEVAGLWNLSLEDSIIIAFKNRAELEQQLTNRNIAEQNRRLALSDIGPQVSIGANYNISDPFATSYTSFSGGASDQYSLSATVRLLLFDGGAARASAAQQQANKAIAETNFANTRNQVRFNVERDYANLQANLANIRTSTVALAQARESLRLARLRFQAGVGTQTDVISAENDLTTSEGNRVSAILNYNISLASLQRDISASRLR